MPVHLTRGKSSQLDVDRGLEIIIPLTMEVGLNPLLLEGVPSMLLCPVGVVVGLTHSAYRN
jgi:hypothetical protein